MLASSNADSASSRAHRSSNGTSQGFPPWTPASEPHCRKPAQTLLLSAGSFVKNPEHGSEVEFMPAYVS